MKLIHTILALLTLSACGDDGVVRDPHPEPKVCLGEPCLEGSQDTHLTCNGRWYGTCIDGVPHPGTVARACERDHHIVCVGDVAMAVPCATDDDCVGICKPDGWCRTP